MIIFYDKKTGDIVGTIDGRIHSRVHLNMWAGNKDETERIIILWRVIKKEPIEEEREVLVEVGKDENGKKLFRRERRKVRRMRNIWKPDHLQKDLFEDIDKRKAKIHDYKIDLKTKNLVKKKAS